MFSRTEKSRYERDLILFWNRYKRGVNSGVGQFHISPNLCGGKPEISDPSNLQTAFLFESYGRQMISRLVIDCILIGKFHMLFLNCFNRI